MRFLKQSTAHTFRIGPFVDQADGFTVESGLTLSQADYRLSKAGGAFAQKNETTAGAHDENGWYTCILDTTDTNTLGPLVIAVNESGALPVWHEFTVLAANVFDSLIGGGDTLDVQVTGMGANTLTASALASDAVTEIQSGLSAPSVDDIWEAEIAPADDISAEGTPTARRRLRQLWQDNVKR